MILKIKKALHNSLNLGRFGRYVRAIVQEKTKEIRTTIVKVGLKRRLAYLCKESGITDEKTCEHDVIVSLTSYGKRICDVYWTIESLMQQTIKPNKIILWLAEDEFNLGNIPQTLKKLQKRGLTIEFCEDIRSYKKLVPALLKYPDDIIITVDDDIIFGLDFVERLLKSYKENPECIHFLRGERITFKGDFLLSYNHWDNHWDTDINEVSILNFPTGGAGVLYPPNSLHKEVTNKEVFMKLCPTADDVWFKSMSLLKGTLCKKTFTRSSTDPGFIFMDGKNQLETTLMSINVFKNDEQIKAVFEKYNICKLLNDGE